MWSMYRSVVVKKELSREAKLSIYQSIYAPTLTYGHELWVMTERIRSRIQAAEMSFLRRVAGCSLRDRVRSSVTQEELGVQPLLLHIERGQLSWLGHVSDASWTSPWGGVSGMPHREETPGKTQDTLERLCLSADLGTPRDLSVLRLSAPRTQPAQVLFTPAPGYHTAWMQQQQKTRAKCRERTSSPPPPTVFKISTRNRFATLCKTECHAVIIGDSIVRHVLAILNKNIGGVVLHAGMNDIRLRQTEILKKDFRSLVEKVEVIRETGRKVLGVSSGRRKEDKETWWWNEEVQDSIQRKRLAKKKWDMDRTEENRQEYKELQRRVKREVSKAKQKAYDELYTRLDTRKGQKDFYRLARQRDRDGKDVQQVRVIKDRDGRVLTSEESVQRRWKEYFEQLMNEENEREKRGEGVNSVKQKVDKIRKDDIPVEVWKCR
ncbi:hypothetical protein QTP86_008164 [Hemibagrus guttatus]|nr:hypothetical protein QTP86_008164 [Hemibagrus guttatus]